MAKLPLPLRLTPAELLEIVAREIALELRVCMPARVVQYIAPEAGPRPTPPRARVMIDFSAVVAGEPDEAQPGDKVLPPEAGEALLAKTYGDAPILVPVHFPGGWGGWSRGELLPGELGKLVFSDRSLDEWQIDGGVGDPIVPAFGHLHGFNLCDAWFEPGVRSGKSMSALAPGPSTIPAGSSAWGLADGTAGIEVRHPTGDPTTQRDLRVATTGQQLQVDAATKILAGTDGLTEALAKAAAVSGNLDALNQAVQSIPATGIPQADAALTAVKVAFAAAFALFVPIATTKLEGQ